MRPETQSPAVYVWDVGSQAWWPLPVIPALRKLRQKDVCELIGLLRLYSEF